MLAKLTSKNQLTLPKQALEAMGPVSHFQVEVDGDRLVLTPARIGAAAAKLRVVFDTNIVVSALVFGRGLAFFRK